MYTISFDDSNLSHEQRDFLLSIEHMNPDKVHLVDLLIVEIDDPLLYQAIDTLTKRWFTRESRTLPPEPIQPPEEIATAKPNRGKVHTPTGKCARCGRDAVLAKASGLCKPCHISALRATKALFEYKPPTGEHPGDERNRAASRRITAEIDERVEAVVAKAQAAGTIGTCTPLNKEGELVLSGKRVG